MTVLDSVYLNLWFASFKKKVTKLQAAERQETDNSGETGPSLIR